MSSNIYFHPSEEKIKALKEEVEKNNKASSYGGFNCEPSEQLFYLAMKQPENFSNPNFSNISFSFQYYLKTIVENTRKEVKKQILEEIEKCEDERKWFHFRDKYSNYIDTECMIKSTVEKLVLLNAVVKQPDYFDEKDRWYSLVEDIKEEIDGFSETAYDCVIKEVIDEYDEFKENDYGQIE